MISKLIEKNGYWYCSNCRMRVDLDNTSYCEYCGCNFSNYEEVTRKLWNIIFDDEVRV